MGVCNRIHAALVKADYDVRKRVVLAPGVLWGEVLLVRFGRLHRVVGGLKRPVLKKGLKVIHEGDLQFSGVHPFITLSISLITLARRVS